MFGWNLIHAGFLAAGLAVALPIVIHLLYRQKTRTLPIGSVRFLHQVVREHRRRRRVRQWLLLALRMLALLLLAALFARPYWDESYNRGLQQEVVVLIDRSASMQAKDNAGRTALDRAVEAARRELSNFDENVVVHVALCDAAGIKEVPVEQMPKAVATDAATDYALALSWAGDILAASGRASRRIVLIGDMQRSGMPRGPVAPLPEGVELSVIDVGEPLAQNVAIESAAALQTEIRPDGKVTLGVVLRNFGPITVKKVPVRCEVVGSGGKKIVVAREVDIAGHGRISLDLPLDIEVDGVYRGQVSVAHNDALALDNLRWVAFEARHPDRVLLVDGEEGRSIFGNETYFLETALRLAADDSAGRLRSFEAERIVWESGKGFPRLDGYRAVVLANVRKLAPADGERMDAYVRSGGRLLIFVGDQVTAESLAPLASHDLLPGKVAAAPIEGRFRVDEWDADHPALACFSDPQHGDLRRVVFAKILPLEKPAPDTRVLLKSGDFVVAADRPVGRGRSLYVGSTADRDWTDLPRTRMYVPLVRQLLAYLTDQLSDRAAVTQRLVEKPDDKIGIESIDDRLVVTNLDPRESVLDRVTPDDLSKTFGATKPKSDTAAEAAALGITISSDALRPDEIWTTVAWLLLIVLAAETLLAGRVHA
ncbi:MAG: hypothetical protein EXS05_07440 [Planctomycetaceae bacterium]|nr:hypothetical protein [Planctomycetaceae bacterium]